MRAEENVIHFCQTKRCISLALDQSNTKNNSWLRIWKTFSYDFVCDENIRVAGKEYKVKDKDYAVRVVKYTKNN